MNGKQCEVSRITYERRDVNDKHDFTKKKNWTITYRRKREGSMCEEAEVSDEHPLQAQKYLLRLY